MWLIVVQISYGTYKLGTLVLELCQLKKIIGFAMDQVLGFEQTV